MRNKFADLDNIRQLKPYISRLAEQKYFDLPENLQAKLIDNAIAMSKIGVDCEEDHKCFIYILRHAPKIGSELSGKKLDQSEISYLADTMYQYRKKYPPNSILNFYHLTAFALKEMDMPIKKMAYPVEEGKTFVEPSYDIKKWMTTMQSYYVLLNQGYPQTYCLGLVTNGWDEMERKDFKYWMSFYEENAHNKYKTAQEAKYYQAGEGAMIPLDYLRAKLPGMPDMSQFPAGTDINSVIDPQAKKQQVEGFIKAIVGRLNAAERLVTRPDVQAVLQKMLHVGLPVWLESLHKLKREIQTAPIQAMAAFNNLKIREINHSATDLLLQDLIIREGNILQNQGKSLSARLMFKLAQEIPNQNQALPPPQPPPQPDPNASQLPNNAGNGSDALNELIDGMNNRKDDCQDLADINDIEDMENDPLSEITVIAQAVPSPKTPIEVEDEILDNPPNPPKPQPTEIIEEQTPTPTSTPTNVTTSNEIEPGNVNLDPFEAALSHVSIVDVVTRLEALANIFRNREIARQLAIIDLMMDRLGIASFFPSLAEASSKSLESNQYALTRIEDILSKLRGSIETPEKDQVDLAGPVDQATSPIPNANPEQVKQNLIQDQTEEKIKKERRKQMEDAKMNPQVTSVPEELSQPVNIQAPTAR